MSDEKPIEKPEDVKTHKVTVTVENLPEGGTVTIHVPAKPTAPGDSAPTSIWTRT